MLAPFSWNRGSTSKLIFHAWGVPDAEALLPTRATALGAPREFLSAAMYGITKRSHHPQMSRIPRPSVQVLIVDDEPFVRMVARAILEDAGFEPVEAATADEALRILADAHDFAAVVSDIEMPGEMNGLELAWAIRAQWPKIAVVLTSGRQLPRPVDMPLKVRFVAKPYHPAHLVQIVTEATS